MTYLYLEGFSSRHPDLLAGLALLFYPHLVHTEKRKHEVSERVEKRYQKTVLKQEEMMFNITI